MNPDLSERIARRIAEVHGAADTTREPLYEDDAEAVIEVVAEFLIQQETIDEFRAEASAFGGPGGDESRLAAIAPRSCASSESQAHETAQSL